jgi:hypothetical protein
MLARPPIPPGRQKRQNLAVSGERRVLALELFRHKDLAARPGVEHEFSGKAVELRPDRRVPQSLG